MIFLCMGKEKKQVVNVSSDYEFQIFNGLYVKTKVVLKGLNASKSTVTW